jgi:class 3 adenylate cyclase/tetratricopeptide (TPR) repeat protein
VISQRKTVSVVFADLVESTTLAERLDPEVLAGILRRYFASLQSVVHKHGGRVEKFIGDAVVGVFGVPTLHEDDALRAVRAALEMHEALSGLNSELDAGLGVALRARIGVNTGEVLVSDDDALGHAISMAARLEQHASAGEVLIGKATFALVAQAVEVEPTDELIVKGSNDPIAAWRVTGLRQVVPRGSRAGGAYIGRERELEQIAAAFDSAVSQPACVTVTVVAPPGLGKSRLIAEGVSRLVDDARVLRGACLPYGEGITYAPLIEAVNQLEAAEGPDALDRLLAGKSDAAQVAASVRTTMAGAARGSPDETAWAFRRLFEALAVQRPLVLVVDDIHWADPLLLDLVEYVGTFSVGNPILLLCAARPDLFDARPDWSAPRDNSLQLRLAPLTAAEVDGLLAQVAGDALDTEARLRIVETSGGVPLFVEQMAAFDAESGGAGTQVPPTIRAVLAARVDRLPPTDRVVLEHAAIQGLAFRRDALAQLLPAETRTALGAALIALVRRDFVRPEPTPDGQDGFAFNHTLIRDAVYEQMPRRLRADLHERYSEVLRKSGADRSEELIGHHLEQAHRERSALGESGAEVDGLGVRAGIALAAAGRNATARKQSSRAVDLLNRANELLKVDRGRRVTVLPDLIDALVEQPDIDAAAAVLKEAVALARSLADETSELRAELAWAVTEPRRDAIGWQERTLVMVERALDRFGREGDHASMAQALLIKGLATSPRDQEDAILTLKKAQAEAQLSDDERIQVDVWDELGGAMIFGPTPYSETLEFTRREVDWAREHGIAFAIADGRLGEAYSLAAMAEYDAALTVLHELIEFFAQLPGGVSQHGESYTLAGRIERDRGNPGAAAAYYRRAMAIFEQGGQRRWWRNAAPGVVHALLDLDRVEEAKAVLDEIASRDDVANDGEGAFRLDAEARFAARIGNVTGGLELARRAVDVVANTGAPFYEGRARETLADLLASAGDAAGAERELDLAKSLYLAKGYLPGVVRIESRLA